jgi:hypothetical protein
MRTASLARSPTSAWSRAGLDVGADAAVPQQVDAHPQDRRISSSGVTPLRRDRAWRRASGDSWMSFSLRDQTPPPVEISARS